MLRRLHLSPKLNSRAVLAALCVLLLTFSYYKKLPFCGHYDDLVTLIMAVLAPLAAALLGFWERDGSWLGFAFWDPGLDWRIVAPSLAIWLLLCAFCAGGAAFATRLPAAAAASASFLPFVLGFFADGLASSEHLAVRALAPLLPSVRDFWLAEALANGGSVSSSALPLAALHAAAWSAMALAVGTLALRRRDL